MLFDTPADQTVGPKINAIGFGSNPTSTSEPSKPMVGMGSTNLSSKSTAQGSTTRSGEYVFVQTPTAMGHFIPPKEGQFLDR